VPSSASPSHSPTWREVLLVAAAAVVWLFLLAPPPAYFLTSAETGHQLAGAWNLLHFGQWPHVDYVTSYGPGRYCVSALGLLLTDGSLLGELLTRSLGHVAYLVLLQVLLRRIGTGTATTWLLLAAAAVALPPGHKYWTALCPLIALYCAHRCCVDDTRANAVGLGAAIGFAALFRPDYGLFALVAGLAVAASNGSPPGRRARRFGALLAGMLMILLPWLLAVGARKNLVTLFAEWLQVGSGVGHGLGMPHPLLHWNDLSLSAAFLFVVAVPLIGLVLAWRRPHPSVTLQRFAVAVYLFALVNLVQSSHRADWPHLLQGIAPAFVALALVLRWPGPAVPRLRVHLVMPLLFLGLLLPGRVMMPWAPAESWQHWSSAALPKREFARRYLQPTPLGQLARVAQDCLAADAVTAFYPFTPQLHYYAERPFAAELPFLAPGFFDGAAQQDRSIAALESERPALLFWNEDDPYDGRDDRNSVNTHARLYGYVISHYARAGYVDDFTVFRRNDAPAFPAGCALRTPF
jgi:hypothetical protein